MDTDKFIYVISHHLRTPITVIGGYLSMLSDGSLGELSQNQKNVLSKMQGSTKTLSNFITSLLFVSRLETGKYFLSPDKANLLDIANEVIKDFQPTFVASNLKLIYEPPAEFPTTLLDVGKINLVIWSLIDNAVRFSKTGGSITIELKNEVQELSFVIRDDGIGVPEGDKSSLFTKFYRANNAKVAYPDGIGMGLYLTKNVIESHKGEIVFESVERQGSTFGFKLPILNEVPEQTSN